jgi:hypothetical protein
LYAGVVACVHRDGGRFAACGADLALDGGYGGCGGVWVGRERWGCGGVGGGFRGYNDCEVLDELVVLLVFGVCACIARAGEVEGDLATDASGGANYEGDFLLRVWHIVSA